MVLPYINMNLPRVYTCPHPEPPSYHPSGSSQCTSPKHPVSCIEPRLAIHFLCNIIHVSMPFSQIIPPSPSPCPSPSPTQSKRLESCGTYTQPVHSEGDQPWVYFERTDTKAETPVLWPPHVKCWLIGKDSDAGRDWGQEQKGTTEDEMAGWHHRLDGREFEWTLGVGDGKEAWRAAIHGVAKSRTQLSDWTELKMEVVLLKMIT